jgi:hypothetical protein
MAKVRTADGQGNVDFHVGWTLEKQGKFRYVFRRRSWRLLVEKDDDGWFYTWRKERNPLGVFVEIVDPAGENWIVEPPELKPHGGSTIPYPRHPMKGLATSLRWADFMQLQGAPELAHERPRLGAVVQVLKALSEAHRRDHQKLFDSLEVVAARYLQKLTFEHLQPPPRPQRGGLRLVVPRSLAAEKLAEWWLRYLAKPAVDPSAVVEEYLRDLWQGSYYAKITVGLSRLGPQKVGSIVDAFRDARERLAEEAERQKAARRLCEFCLRDVGQDCQGGRSHEAGRNLYWNRAWDLAKGLVRASLIVQGMPRAKARSLFDRQRKIEARTI